MSQQSSIKPEQDSSNIDTTKGITDRNFNTDYDPKVTLVKDNELRNGLSLTNSQIPISSSYLSTVIPQAVDQIKHSNKWKDDEDQILVRLALKGHYEFYNDHRDEIKELAKKKTNHYYKVDVKPEQFTTSPIGEEADNAIKFKPLYNTAKTAEWVEDIVNGHKTMYLRAFLLRGVMEFDFLDDFIQEKARENYENIIRKMKENIEETHKRFEKEAIGKAFLENRDKIDTEIENLEDARNIIGELT